MPVLPTQLSNFQPNPIIPLQGPLRKKPAGAYCCLASLFVLQLSPAKMRLTYLSLSNFRNYSRLELELPFLHRA